MRILLTNDDGINAPGIVALHDALAGTGAASNRFGGPLLSPAAERDTTSRAPRSVVFPIAPLTVQSATSHGVTFHQPLMTRRVKVNERMQGIAVDARPADCVKLAISQLWPERFEGDARPDLLISGMNAGANCGINIIYSGTVAAALEGAFLGVPSIAVSLHLGRGRADFELAAAHARRAIEAVIAAGLPRPHECISINVPITEEGSPDETPPIRVCPMNTHGLVDQYERRESPGGEAYYWACGYGLDFRATEAGSDVDLLLKRCITVTPLWYDLTNHATLGRWKERLESPR